MKYKKIFIACPISKYLTADGICKDFESNLTGACFIIWGNKHHHNYFNAFLKVFQQSNIKTKTQK